MYSRGRVLPQDDAEAASWFRKAADQGQPEAQFQLGDAYRQGKGVARDSRHAALWYGKAAEQGFSAAQEQLGLMYEDGLGCLRIWSNPMLG